MESENESLQDHDMSSNASSSRASTPSIPEHFHSACLRRKLIEQELKTYTDSIDHTEILMKNLERQGLLDHPIYTNHRTMIHGLRRQRDRLSGFLNLATIARSTQSSSAYNSQQPFSAPHPHQPIAVLRTQAQQPIRNLRSKLPLQQQQSDE
ncbi:hypothetical protein NPIL_536441, partial [Nephila pilipes]